MGFKVQIQTKIVKNNKLSALEFVLLAKLIQVYYLIGQKNIFEIEHKKLMYLLGISDNNTFKKAYNNLVKYGYLIGEVKTLPRRNGLTIQINTDIIPKKNDKVAFTQVTKDVLDKSIISTVGYVGIRLIYYYQSYINKKMMDRGFCFASEETIANHLGITKKTVIEYNKKLEKCKFVKIDRHKLQNEEVYERKSDKEIIVFNKYNNHYFVMEKNISKFVEKNSGILV